MSDHTETLSPILPKAIEEQAERVLKAAGARHLMLVTAESCTGGLLASLLTDVEGSSSAFERGFVTYSERSKCELLGLAQEQIERCGVVSEAVARAMAEGALVASRGDIALAITGFAGPGGPEDEEGLVHFACATRDGPVVTRGEHFGAIGRGPVRLQALATALDLIERAIATA